jgi:hypothetical protein
MVTPALALRPRRPGRKFIRVPAEAMSHLRRTWSYMLVAADEHAFDDAVRDYMRAARKAGMPIERVIVTMKQELGTLTPAGAEFHRASALVQRAVQIVITEFFEPG